jgi:TonB-linked SusC/RagA family outer membrane protein
MQKRAICASARGGTFTKLLLIMKFTAIFFLSACLGANATGYSQISLSETNVPLQKVFKEIEKQSGYDFLFSYELLQKAGNISVNVRGVSLRKAVEACLKGKGLTYEILAKTVVITPGPVTPVLQPVIVPPPPDEIRGRVTDSTGTPLAGASVVVKGTKQVVLTDDKGIFTLTGVADGASLIISYVGYNTEVIRWSGLNNGNIRIVLRHNNNPLDDVQIIAYGTNTRRFSVGSVSTVTAEDIEQQPVTNVLLALQGRVPGLVINPSSGVPGSSVKMQIRGQNTLQSDPTNSATSIYDQPLIIVDGLPYAAQNVNLSLLASLGGNNFQVAGSGISPINGINTADIESVTVLKDADATSIYGSQGANGVIVITTKKGKPGKTVFNLSVNTGPNKVTRAYKMMNTPQYLQMRHEAFANDGLTPTAANAPDLLVFDTTKNTDWVRQFFGGTSNNTYVHGSLSGGTSVNTFILSGGYSRSAYDFPGDFSDNTWTLHTGLHHASLDHKFNADFGSDISYDQNNSSGSPDVTKAFFLPPDFPDMTDASGNLIWNYKGTNIASSQAYGYLKETANLQNFTNNNTLKLSYELLPGLKLSANTGYSRSAVKEYTTDPLAAQSPAAPVATASFAGSTYQTINIEPQIDYNRLVGRGVLNLTAGGTYRKNTFYSNTMTGQGYTDDALLGSIDGASSSTSTDNSTIYKYTGAFARAGYVYDRKYIVNFTGRRDGSSNFGPGHQFGNFGSAGAGWIFSEEKGFSTALPFISYAKIAGNYGTNGSDGVQGYQFLDYWTSYTSYNYLANYQGTRGLSPVNPYNPDFSWASKKGLNLSLDLGLLKNRLLVNANYYVDRTSDQLVEYTLPTQTGFTQVQANLNATVQDKGLELAITSDNIKTKNFHWTSTFNISGNRNKLVAFPGLATSSYASIYTLGKSTSLVYGFKYKGINDTTGLYQFYKADGKTATYYPSYARQQQGGDEIPIGDPGQPVFQGGLGNTITYKGLSLMVYFQFSKYDQQHNYLSDLGGTPGQENTNLPAALLGKFWQKPGDHVPLEKLSTGLAGGDPSAEYEESYFNASTGAYSEDFYVRLKTLSLSYSLSGKWVKRMHMSGCRIYVNAENLLTFTDYKFEDPELPGNPNAIPLQRIIMGGLSFDF